MRSNADSENAACRREHRSMAHATCKMRVPDAIRVRQS